MCLEGLGEEDTKYLMEIAKNDFVCVLNGIDMTS